MHTMRNEARRARKARLEAAKRLIEHQHTPPVQIQPKKPKHPTRRMVPPVELSVKVAAV
jgi:hypothetical protein